MAKDVSCAQFIVANNLLVKQIELNCTLRFVGEYIFLTYFLHFLQVVVNINAAGDGVHFRRAGPRDKVFISICYLIIILPTFVSLPTL